MFRAIPVLGAMLLLAPTGASGQLTREDTGTNANRLRPAVSQAGIIDIESAEIAGGLSLDVGLWSIVGRSPMRLFNRAGAGDPALQTTPDSELLPRAPYRGPAALVDRRVDAHAIITVGLWERFELAASLQFTPYQDRLTDVIVDGVPGRLDPLQSYGLGDLSLQPKVRILKARDAHFDLALYAPITLPTSSGASYFGERTVTVAPALAVSRELGSGIRLAGNIGYRFRPELTVVSGVPIDDQVHFGLGFALRKPAVGWSEGHLTSFEVAASLSGEVPGARADAARALMFKGSYERPIEVSFLLSLGYWNRWRVFFGGGVPLSPAQTAPVVRAIVGVSFHSGDRDEDGIADSEDRCPGEAEDLDHIQDADGCPEVDADGDGVPDESDVDPLEPEDGRPQPQ